MLPPGGFRQQPSVRFTSSRTKKFLGRWHRDNNPHAIDSLPPRQEASLTSGTILFEDQTHKNDHTALFYLKVNNNHSA